MINKILSQLGYQIVKKNTTVNFPHEEAFVALQSNCSPYSMTSPERMYGLYRSLLYLEKYKLAGSLVECGVWRGGSAMMMASTLKSLGNTQRQLYLYDTFEGMPPPTSADIDVKGNTAEKLMKTQAPSDADSVWCVADLAEVKRNMASTKYPENNIHYIQGKVEDTLPAHLPQGPIALLRLDTDWYESTQHLLQHLFPLLIPGGVLIVDDYGHWAGCRKAVEEYFEDKPILLHRVDYTGVAGVVVKM